MGQSSTFYEIKKTDFNKVKDDISLFNMESESMEILEKNTFGIEFVLKKTLDSKYHGIVEQIFSPKEYLGEKPNYENMDFAEIDFLEFEDNSISYLTPNQISVADNLLNSVTESEIRENYNSSELNSNGIYPKIWHDDESDNQAINKRHIVEGIDQIKSILSRAKRNGNYIFVFSG